MGPCRDGLEGLTPEVGRPRRRLGPGVMERVDVLAGTELVGLDSEGNRVRAELHRKDGGIFQADREGRGFQAGRTEPCVLKPDARCRKGLL